MCDSWARYLIRYWVQDGVGLHLAIRLPPDPDEKESVLLETFSVQEADITAFPLAHIIN